ncbi:hypothetical protein [Bradyrhizobium sp. 174]|uniref:hypothetical protein n=1 Tax=Bradyrhizobium sp. 174 TaxID=2782645 RepID=UPI001FF738EF|nr:hypothetical protein [Bradyrhizobium sp. 174]MCK1577797.1 hypothetical protein [Bradyrhizobium sp. 174]
MDDAGLIEAVENALAAGAKLESREHEDYFSVLRSLTVAQGADEAVEKVRIAIDNHPKLEELRKSFFWPGLSPGGVGILAVHLAHWLVAKALLQGGDAATAVNALKEFNEKNEVYGIRVLVAHGAVLEDYIKIDDATWALPFSRIFSSIGTSQLWRVLSSVGIDGAEVFALVQRFKMHPAVRSNFEPAPGWTMDHEREFKRLDYLAYSLALLPGTAVNVISRWVDIADIGAVPGLSGGTLGELNLEILPKRAFPSPLQLLNPADVIEAVRRFAKLPPGDQGTCYISLHRLALAATRSRDEDRAIELGVSLEAIFGQDQRGD